jgi:hypothetical protein
VNQEFLLLGLRDLLDNMEKKEKKACQVLQENLVFQEIKVIMNQRPVELTEEWASS